MNIIVLDLEMCQPSNSIIQIGAVALNIRSGKIVSEFNFICNPGELPDEYITNLTGILPEQVAEAPALSEVLESFWKWIEFNGTQMAAWGSDIWEIKGASKKLGVEIPKKIKSLDLKQMSIIFRAALPNNKTKMTGGLMKTMEVFGVTPEFGELKGYKKDSDQGLIPIYEGHVHDAYWDARNTALLLIKFKNIIEKYFRIEHEVKRK